MKITIENLKQISRLSKKTNRELRGLNPHGAYSGKELTKYQLIFQIVFLMDAPNN